MCFRVSKMDRGKKAATSVVVVLQRGVYGDRPEMLLVVFVSYCLRIALLHNYGKTFQYLQSAVPIAYR